MAVEWSGTAKALAKIVETITRSTPPPCSGWLACTLAYREAAETEIRVSPRPESRLPFSADLVRDHLAKFKLEDPNIMKGFSFEAATGHPFVRASDQASLDDPKCGGYSDSQSRAIIRATRADSPRHSAKF